MTLSTTQSDKNNGDDNGDANDVKSDDDHSIKRHRDNNTDSKQQQ